MGTAMAAASVEPSGFVLSRPIMVTPIERKSAPGASSLDHESWLPPVRIMSACGISALSSERKS